MIERQGQLPLETLAIYAIDTVEASALVHLADQFNVLGKRGWLLCETEAQQRELVKAAIELHRYSGTPYAIRRAFTAVGFGDSEIEENPPWHYDGLLKYGDPAPEIYSGRVWGGFYVFLDLGKRSATQQQVALIRELALEWKNVRSHLLGIGFRRTLLPYSGLPTRFYDGATVFNTGSYDSYTVFYNGDQTFDGDYNE